MRGKIQKTPFNGIRARALYTQTSALASRYILHFFSISGVIHRAGKPSLYILALASFLIVSPITCGIYNIYSAEIYIRINRHVSLAARAIYCIDCVYIYAFSFAILYIYT